MIGPAASPSNHREKQEAIAPTGFRLTASEEPGKVDGMLHGSMNGASRVPVGYRRIVDLRRRVAAVGGPRGAVR